MDRKICERDRSAIYIIKAFAMLSVIAAHVVELDDGSLFEVVIFDSWKLYGQVGVVLFYFLAGFLYQRTQGDTHRFWKKRLLYMIVPWVLCSSVTFLLNYIKRTRLGGCGHAYSWPQWVLGSGTWYYYITVYIVFLIIFKYISKSKLLLVLCMVATPISTTLTWYGMGQSWLVVPWITTSLNIFNWIGMFALGVLIRGKYGSIWPSNKIVILAGLVTVITALLLGRLKIFTYFHPLSLLFEASCACLVVRGAYYIDNHICLNKIRMAIETFGKNTYFCFLLHMQIVQAFARIIPQGWFKQLSAPILAAILMYGILRIITITVTKIHLQKWLYLIGIKAE